jgi:hypothetical protein
MRLGLDCDGDGTIGSISNDGNNANDPVINSSTVRVTATTTSGTTTLSSLGNSGVATAKIDTSMTISSNPGLVGFTVPFGSGQLGVASKQVATQVVMTDACTLTSVSAYVNGPSPKMIRFGIYSDSGGEPANLLAQSYVDAIGGNAADYHWVTFFIPSTSVAAGNYWLALGMEHSNMEYAFDATGGQTRMNNNDPVVSGFNTPWGTSSTSNTRRVNIYAQRFLQAFGPLVMSSNTEYENTNPPTGGLFRDINNAPLIQRGNDISANATHYPSINFTAASGLVSDCLTVYDADPTNVAQTNFTGSIRVSTDVLFVGSSSARYLGIGALHNEVSGKSGLTLVLKDNGNSDRIQIFRTPATGDFTGATPLAESSNFNDIVANQWFRLILDITCVGSSVQIDGRVFAHSTASNPNSLVTGAPLASVSYSSTSAALTGLQNSGEVTLGFDTTDTATRASVTNFRIDEDAGPISTAAVISWTQVP